LQEVLKLLVWGAALTALAWFFFSRVSFLQNMRFSDLLFIVGAIELMIATVGMMRGPEDYTISPGMGRLAFPVKITEEEKREAMVADFIERNSFAVRMLIIGLLTFLASGVLTYLFH
jgi:hypothetical protein